MPINWLSINCPTPYNDSLNIPDPNELKSNHENLIIIDDIMLEDGKVNVKTIIRERKRKKERKKERGREREREREREC